MSCSVNVVDTRSAYDCLQVQTGLIVRFLSFSPGSSLLPQKLTFYSDLSSHSCLLFAKELLFTVFAVTTYCSETWTADARALEDDKKLRCWLLDPCRVLWPCPAVAQWRGNSGCAARDNEELEGRKPPHAVLSWNKQLKTWGFTRILS